jgi:hypothetical protein
MSEGKDGQKKTLASLKSISDRNADSTQSVFSSALAALKTSDSGPTSSSNSLSSLAALSSYTPKTLNNQQPNLSSLSSMPTSSPAATSSLASLGMNHRANNPVNTNLSALASLGKQPQHGQPLLSSLAQLGSNTLQNPTSTPLSSLTALSNTLPTISRATPIQPNFASSLQALSSASNVQQRIPKEEKSYSDQSKDSIASRIAAAITIPSQSYSPPSSPQTSPVSGSTSSSVVLGLRRKKPSVVGQFICSIPQGNSSYSSKPPASDIIAKLNQDTNFTLSFLVLDEAKLKGTKIRKDFRYETPSPDDIVFKAQAKSKSTSFNKPQSNS